MTRRRRRRRRRRSANGASMLLRVSVDMIDASRQSVQAR
jgi:hypothetical protein